MNAVDDPATLEDVLSRSSTRIAAPRGLARLLVILGVLVGLTGLHGSHCSEEFAALVHTTMCPTSATYHTAALDTIDSHGAVLYEAPPKDPHEPIGAAGLCLAVLMAVLLIAAALSGPALLGIALSRVRSWLRSSTQRDRAAPSLAMLCVLRT